MMFFQQAGNTVPMIGKKASLAQSEEREISEAAEAGSTSRLLYLLRFLDLGLRYSSVRTWTVSLLY